MTTPSRADVCAVAVADCFTGDGTCLANPIGTIPMIGGRLARLTTEPELMMTDSEAALIANDEAFRWPGGKVVETWNPYRRMFDIVWSGRRHVMMGATQIDRFGNQNLAALGPDPHRPKVQLLGFRGAPGNTINDVTSYWVAGHGPRVLTEKVDIVSGVGYDRAAEVGTAGRFHEIRRVVTNLAVLDFETPDRSMRLRSVHPWATVDEVVSATGFALVVPDDVPTSRLPEYIFRYTGLALFSYSLRHSVAACFRAVPRGEFGSCAFIASKITRSRAAIISNMSRGLSMSFGWRWRSFQVPKNL